MGILWLLLGSSPFSLYTCKQRRTMNLYGGFEYHIQNSHQPSGTFASCVSLLYLLSWRLKDRDG